MFAASRSPSVADDSLFPEEPSGIPVTVINDHPDPKEIRKNSFRHLMSRFNTSNPRNSRWLRWLTVQNAEKKFLRGKKLRKDS
jgi:hypothetical protein